MHAYRSHTCGALRAADTGHTVRLSGWIHRKRDHGGLVFIDLRDHYGLTQLVLAPDTPGFAVVERLRAENVIRVDGEVVVVSAGPNGKILSRWNYDDGPACATIAAANHCLWIRTASKLTCIGK